MTSGTIGAHCVDSLPLDPYLALQGGRAGARQALARYWASAAALLPFDTAALSGWDSPAVLAPAMKA